MIIYQIAWLPLLKGPVYQIMNTILDHLKVLKKEQKKKKGTFFRRYFIWPQWTFKREDDVNNTNSTSDTSEYVNWRCEKGLKDIKSREKCGHKNISNEECVKMGCCYNNQGYNVPACYKSTNYQGKTYETSLSIDIPELTASDNGHLINPYKNDKCKDDKNDEGSKIKEDYMWM